MRLSLLRSLGLRLLAGSPCLLLLSCGGSSTGADKTTPPAATTYTLTVNSSNPAAGVSITVAPADNSGAASGLTSFTRTYNLGATVTLTAPASSGANTFSAWSGCASVNGATCTVSLNASMSVTANYATPVPTVYTLTVNSGNPSSGLVVAASPADNKAAVSVTTAGTLSYNSGTAVVLTAPATAGPNAFGSWTGCTSTSGLTCNLTLSANSTVLASYTTPVPTYALTVNSTNPASGVAITIGNPLNNVVSTQNTSFTLPTASGTILLTAPATAGNNTFASWTGCTSVNGMICTMTPTANTTVTANYTTPVPTFTLTVNSSAPGSGASVTATPRDVNGTTTGTTPLTLTYVQGTAVTVSASTAIGSTAAFQNWAGCDSAQSNTCNVSLTSNATVTANYATNLVTSVNVLPSSPALVIGATQQFSASVTGAGTYSRSVTWTLTGPAGYTGALGTISSTGSYTTPSPAPPSVTVVATSVTTPAQTGNASVTLSAPATAAGPALNVNIATVTRPISPLIYGVNGYLLDTASQAQGNFSIIRWGGDDISRYNYVANTTNSAADYYFENFTGAGGMWPQTDGNWTSFVTASTAVGAQSVMTAPVIGWVSSADTSALACSFPNVGNPTQTSYSYSGSCGSGSVPGANNSTTNLPGGNAIAARTSMQEPPPAPPATAAALSPSWTQNWVAAAVKQFGAGNSATGVAHWDLDNEPEYWSAVHRDVHPNPMTYDEVTNGGIGSALAIKTADPTALVSGPVISGWSQYFYSQQDVQNGYSTGPCYQPWSNPADRQAHGGAPLIEYYLQQMAKSSATYGTRLLDYVDIHAYFAANYNGMGTGLTSAGDTAEQTARMNSTRVLWDPTYTDPAYPVPNYPTDPGYSATNCHLAAQPPALIPTLQTWVNRDYPGTKTSIDEYNFGGMESINGAVVQADVLGIFGMYGLDMGMLWPTTNYNTQVPGNMAFAMYRNYDGKNAGFGDMAVSATSANQGQLAVYAARRTSDGALTVMVINKTYGTLTSTLTLPNLTPAGPATPYLYSAANLAAIVAQPAVTVTAPAGAVTNYTLANSFPAQSVTLLVIPTR